MPTYKYEAAYPGGERVSGVVEAVSEAEAVAKIRQSCEMVLSLKEVPKLTAVRNPLTKLRKVNAKSLSLVCRQFSIILKAGMPLVQTVDLVAEQCPDKTLQQLLRQASEDVSNGWSLSYSFEQRGAAVLPVTFRETVRAGEESGDLLASFQRLSEYFERMNKTHESLVSALTYPTIVIIVAVAVIIIVMNFVIPTFSSMFEGMGVELPVATRLLIVMSGFFQKYILILLAAVVLVICCVRLYAHTEKGGMNMAKLQLCLPLIGSVVRMSNASQFAHTMSTLLTAGMSILQCVEVSGKTMSNDCMAGEVLGTLVGVESGHSLGECMSKAKELPPMLVQMVTVGEATGSMESTLEVLAMYYDSETDVKTKRAITLLEPTIIVILSLFVAFILVAVYLPMFSLYSNM